MIMRTIGVVGAGVMGSDIALDMAAHNHKVLLIDLSDEALERARVRIRRSYSLAKMMKKSTCELSLDSILGRINFLLDYDAFSHADIVIENITEKYEAKKRVFSQLGEVCSSNALIGTNTSCISVSRLSASMPHPENVVGMHFMNPAHLKPFVEVIRGKQTSSETVNRTKSFLRESGKHCVVVEDMPGFVSNKVLMITINESIRLLQDKIAKPKDIDAVFKLGFGHKMGPLATADLIGLDTIYDSLMVLYESYGDSKYKPCELLCKMVDEGTFGIKSGKGFFEYGI